MEVLINGEKYIPFVEKGNADYLDIVFTARDIGKELTIREYLRRLLSKLWAWEESFNGKRPFGNSGWQFSVIYALIEAGAIQGTITYDEEGYVEDSDWDREEAERVVQGLISRMCLGE